MSPGSIKRACHGFLRGLTARGRRERALELPKLLDRTPAGTRLCYWSGAEVVVLGIPGDLGADHNCDAMGCGSAQGHVIERINVGALRSRVAAMQARIDEAIFDELRTTREHGLREACLAILRRLEDEDRFNVDPSVVRDLRAALGKGN